jgi:hypothetical protein
MGLSLRQQWRFYRIEDSIRRSDPRFASLMCALSMFALDGEIPEREQLKSRTARGRQVMRSALRRAAFVILKSAHRCWTAIRTAPRTRGRRSEAVAEYLDN